MNPSQVSPHLVNTAQLSAFLLGFDRGRPDLTRSLVSIEPIEFTGKTNEIWPINYFSQLSPNVHDSLRFGSIPSDAPVLVVLGVVSSPGKSSRTCKKVKS